MTRRPARRSGAPARSRAAAIRTTDRGGLPLEKRMQVGAWMNASYDPELKLLYDGHRRSPPRRPSSCWRGTTTPYLYSQLDAGAGREDRQDRLALPARRRSLGPRPPVPAHFDRRAGRARSIRSRPGSTRRSTATRPTRSSPACRARPGSSTRSTASTGEFLWARPHGDAERGPVDRRQDRQGHRQSRDRVHRNRPAALHLPVLDRGGELPSAGLQPKLTKVMYFPAQNLCMNATAVAPNWDNPGYSIASKIALSPMQTTSSA